jgi:hypothetical protein
MSPSFQNVGTFARAGPLWFSFVLIADRLLRSSDGSAFADDRVVISRAIKSTQISGCGVAAAMKPFVEYEALQWPHLMVFVPDDKSSSEPQSEQKHNEPTIFMTSGKEE